MPATADSDGASGPAWTLRSEPGWQASRSFTLLEMLVAMAVFSILAILIATMINETQRATLRVVGQGQSFQGARAAFEVVTRRLSQATLNTFWDYQYSSGGVVTNYFRNSNLEFVCGQTANLVPGTTAASYPTHAVFFQAPVGYSTNSITTGNPTATEGLNNLLNACGFYIAFGSDSPNIPAFMTALGVTGKYRYRLYQWEEPAEKLQVYDPNIGWSWFQTPLSPTAPTDQTQVLAQNVIALIFLPKESVLQDPTGQALTTTYAYDSRSTTSSGTSPLVPPPTYNQLPPEVDVILVAIDEPSAIRLAKQNGTTPPALIPTLAPPAFTVVANLASDLQSLQSNLQGLNVNYRIFRSTVKITGAKWSY